MSWDCHLHVFGDPLDWPPLPGSHYNPPESTFAMHAAHAAAAGVDRAVLVQPSVYGTDNRLLLAALAEPARDDRGIVVVAPDVPETALDRMHALGVRGVRFNCVSVAGNGLDALATLEPRLAARGWHAQIFVSAAQLGATLDATAGCSVPIVLDHLAGLAPGDPIPRALSRRLAAGRTWVKLSGFYRVARSVAPGQVASAASAYADCDELVGAFVRAAPERVVWGSDWPHTWFFEAGHGVPPAYPLTRAPLERVLAGDPRLREQVLTANPALLYTGR